MAIILDVLSHIIQITTPTTTVIIQDLVDVIRDWEDELPNISYNKVIDAVGKANLGSGITTGIIVSLNSEWQIQFFGGSGYTVIRGGTLIGGVGDEPVKATGTANDLTIQIQPTDATIVPGTGGATAIEIREEMDNNSTKLLNIDNNINTLIDEIGGKWIIIGNQMIFYKSDNITEIMRFNLFDENGLPTMTNVMSRERI